MILSISAFAFFAAAKSIYIKENGLFLQSQS
jgi:hypothetical protein